MSLFSQFLMLDSEGYEYIHICPLRIPLLLSIPVTLSMILILIPVLFIESFPQMCFEGKWLQNQLRADKNESRSLSAVDTQGNQRGGFCIVPILIYTQEPCFHAVKFQVIALDYSLNRARQESKFSNSTRKFVGDFSNFVIFINISVFWNGLF